jgi:hypothetical protein
MGSCEFAVANDATPVALSLSPSAGHHADGTLISIALSGVLRPSGGADARVWFGHTECAVQEAIELGGGEVELRVPLCAFAAGTVSASVLLPELGWALGAAPGGHSSLSVTQRLRVDSISPATGSHFGGTQVTIHGSGFGGGHACAHSPSVAGAVVGNPGEPSAHADSAVMVGGRPCAVSSESHAQIICYTAAVPEFTPLRAGGTRPGGGCTQLSAGDSSSLDTCLASCASHSTCNTVALRNFTRLCARYACTACTPASCGFEPDGDGSDSSWFSFTALPQPAARAHVRVHSAGAMGGALFAAGEAVEAAQLTSASATLIDGGERWRLELLGAGIGNFSTGGRVAVGDAPSPDDNLECAVSSWAAD